MSRPVLHTLIDLMLKVVCISIALDFTVQTQGGSCNLIQLLAGTSDPITLINKYIYAANNPILNIDPNGGFLKKYSQIFQTYYQVEREQLVISKYLQRTLLIAKCYSLFECDSGNAVLALIMPEDYIHNFVELQGPLDQSGKLNQNTLTHFGKEGMKDSLPA